VKETTLQTPRSVKKEGWRGRRRCSRHQRRDPSLAARDEDHGEQAFTLKYMEVHSGAYIHL